MAGKERAPAHPLERIMVFTDAVFAIAITLLVIGINVPKLPRGASNIEQITALANLIPNFIGFFVSFAVIGAFWSVHHRAFSLASHYAPGLQIPNMMLLCAIAFMPFATAYMSENYGERVPHLFYYAVLLVTALLNMHVVSKVTAPPYVNEDADAEAVAVARAGQRGATSGVALALVVSFVAPTWGHVALVTVPPLMALAIRRARVEARS